MFMSAVLVRIISCETTIHSADGYYRMKKPLNWSTSVQDVKTKFRLTSFEGDLKKHLLDSVGGDERPWLSSVLGAQEIASETWHGRMSTLTHHTALSVAHNALLAGKPSIRPDHPVITGDQQLSVQFDKIKQKLQLYRSTLHRLDKATKAWVTCMMIHIYCQLSPRNKSLLGQQKPCHRTQSLHQAYVACCCASLKD